MADCRPTSAPHGRPHSSISEKSKVRSAQHDVPALPRAAPQMDLFAKEEEYKRLNAELEAKTAELVRQAEEVIRGQSEVLSKPVSMLLSVNFEDELEEECGDAKPSIKQPTTKAGVKKKTSTKPMQQMRPPPGNKRPLQKTKLSAADDVAVPEDVGGFSLAETISVIESRVAGSDNDATAGHVEDDVMPSAAEEMGAEAQIRFLRAKLRVIQEELNRLSSECNKKDDENGALRTKLKEVEEDRARLNRTTNVQQTQMEKQRGLAEESNRKCDGLQQQVIALQKDLEGLKRAQKQAASTHSATEVRLNRALEENQRTKAQLGKIKQSSKDSSSQEQQKIEQLQAENRRLEKQKAELILGFKKQLKLIDILKRQKMHFEAAKMLSFTEEEFMKALDWGNSS